MSRKASTLQTVKLSDGSSVTVESPEAAVKRIIRKRPISALETLRYAVKAIATMSHFVEIYVPSTVDFNGKAVALGEAQARFVAEQFSKEFGGATVLKADGFYYSDELQKLVGEDVTIVRSYFADLTQEQVDYIVILANSVKSIMRQESVLFVIDGIAYLV